MAKMVRMKPSVRTKGRILKNEEEETDPAVIGVGVEGVLILPQLQVSISAVLLDSLKHRSGFNLKILEASFIHCGLVSSVRASIIFPTDVLFVPVDDFIFPGR